MLRGTIISILPITYDVGHEMSELKFVSRDWGECVLENGVYPDESRALIIRFMDDDSSPVGKLTVSLGIGPLPCGHYLVKTWSENERIAADVLASGLFEDTGKRLPAGRVQAEIWKLKGDAS